MATITITVTQAIEPKESLITMIQVLEHQGLNTTQSVAPKEIGATTAKVLDSQKGVSITQSKPSKEIVTTTTQFPDNKESLTTASVQYPKESIALYPNRIVGERVSAYAEANSSKIPQHIINYHSHVNVTQPDTAKYMISISQAQSLVFLTKLIGAKRILEIGAYVGLSSLAWSHAVGPEGKVTALEFEPYFADLAKKAFIANGAENAEVVVGDALATLPTLMPTEPYDIIFIDAQKTGYPHYLRTILASSSPDTPRRLLRKGGLIIGDNTLRCGFVADDSTDNPWRAYDFGAHRPAYWQGEDVKALKVYNEEVSNSERLENWLCPLWDGVNIGRLLD